MIRNILFDIGNVIVRFDFTRAIQKVAPLSDVPDVMQALAEIDADKIAYEDGKISRQKFLESVFRVLKFRGKDEDFIEAWQGVFWANEPMHDLVRKLHGNYPLYLLSNTNCMHVEGLIRDYDLFGLFTGAIYSHEAQASKPHPAIYEALQRQYAVKPEETFFIDDLEPNIATARSLGFHTHHYHHDRHDGLLQALREAGVSH